MNPLANLLVSAGFGLGPDEVVLVEPRRLWLDAGRRASALIGMFLPSFTQVEHVGSTSVPGLRAKPILDLAAGFDAPIDAGRIGAALGPLGVRLADDLREEGGILFRLEVAPNCFGLHLHCVTRDDPQWISYLTLRRVLRTNADLRDRYAAHKHDLAIHHAGNRPGYTRGKSAFIRKALEAAA